MFASGKKTGKFRGKFRAAAFLLTAVLVAAAVAPGTAFAGEAAGSSAQAQGSDAVGGISAGPADGAGAVAGTVSGAGSEAGAGTAAGPGLEGESGDGAGTAAGPGLEGGSGDGDGTSAGPGLEGGPGDGDGAAAGPGLEGGDGTPQDPDGMPGTEAGDADGTPGTEAGDADGTFAADGQDEGDGTPAIEALSDFGDYNADDIEAINGIIDRNGLGWPKADPAGGFDPEDWPGAKWDEDSEAGDLRITSLDVSGDSDEYGYSSAVTGELDVSGLAELQWLRCYCNDITALDISGLDKLYGVDSFDCSLASVSASGCSGLYALDINQNKLAGTLAVPDLPSLNVLRCGGNRLTGLDLSGCPALRELNCSYNQLASLDVSGCPALYDLSCGGNRLASLDVSGCTALGDLQCEGNRLASLDISGCVGLERLYCHNNKLASLDAPGCPALYDLSCSGNQLASLDVSDCTALRDLYCEGNRLVSLDLSKNAGLESLSCFDNQLALIDVSGCAGLEELSCGYNRLASLDVSDCSGLERLYCNNNQLASLDVAGCPALDILMCDGNRLASIDVSGCAGLKELFCGYNRLDSLDVSKNAGLGSLTCSGNRLASLDVSGCTVLSDLSCFDNQLESLNVSGCAGLRSLGCAENRLAALDVSSCADLCYLSCSENRLGSLNVSGCSSLEDLYCSDNWLVSLDVSGCPLEYLDCTYNFLPGKSAVKGVTNGQWNSWSFNFTPQRGAVKASACNAGDLAAINGIIDNNGLDWAKADPGSSAYLIWPGVVWSSASSNKRITRVEFSGEGLKGALDLSALSGLTNVNCADNGGLSSLNVSGLKKLMELECRDNRLASLDVSGCTNLRYLYCDNNRLDALDLSGIKLYALDCSSNRLESLGVAGMADLYYLDCSYNLMEGPDAVAGTGSIGGFNGWDGYGYIFFPQKKAVTGIDFADAQAINRLIEDNGLRWTPAEPGATAAPDDWIGVTWSGEATGKRIIGLGFPGRVNLLGDVDLTGLGMLETLDCSEFAIQSLDVSGLAALKKLECRFNSIASLEMAGCTALEYLDCGQNQLRSLDVSGFAALNYLDCGRNDLETLIVSGCGDLGFLNCAGNVLDRLDLAGLNGLTQADCSYNRIEDESDVAGTEGIHAFTRWGSDGFVFAPQRVAVQDVDPGDIAVIDDIIENNGLDWTWADPDEGQAPDDWTGAIWSDDPGSAGKRIVGLRLCDDDYSYCYLWGGLDLRKLDELASLDCSGNEISSLKLAGLKKLEYLDCSGNWDIASLDVSTLTSLKALDCSNDNLKALNVSALGVLERLDCSGNWRIKSLDVSKCTKLKELGCASLQLAALNVSKLTGLTRLECDFNNLRTLNLSGLAMLESLSCISNGITSLNLSGCVGLKSMYCYNNRLSGALDLTGLGSLESVNVGTNQLASLNVSGLTALDRLNCSANKLAALDVSRCPALKSLDCSGNKLASLNVSGLAGLTAVDCRQNKMLDSSAVYGIADAGAFTGWGSGGFAYSPQGVKACRITFMPNKAGAAIALPNGTGMPAPAAAAGSSVYIAKNKAYGALPTPKLDGWTFGGWYTSKDGGATLKTKATKKTKATGDAVLYAKWTAKSYTVTYNANGGLIGKAKTVAKKSKMTDAGAKYAMPDDPARAGYVFAGWFRDKAGTDGPVSPDSDLGVLKNHALYALWEGLAYDIVFDANGGSDGGATFPDDYKMQFGTVWGAAPNAKLPVAVPDPGKQAEGYVFKGWSLGASGNAVDGAAWASGAPKPGSGGIASPVTLYAQYGKTVTITFDAGGGKVKPASKTVSTAAGTKYGTLPLPTRTGHVFKGWFDKEDGGFSSEITKLTDVDEDVRLAKPGGHALYAQTLVAKWTPKTYTVKFSKNAAAAVFDGSDANGVLAVAGVEHGAPTGGVLPAPAGNPARDGYVFIGWFTKKSGGKKADPSSPVTKAVTYYAQWAAKGKTVTLNANGGKFGTASSAVLAGLEYDDEYGSTGDGGNLPVPGASVGGKEFKPKSGSSFVGWFTKKSGGAQVKSDDPILFAGASQTLYARWTTTAKTVKLNANGGSVFAKSRTVEWGQGYGTVYDKKAKATTPDVALPEPAPPVHVPELAFDGWHTKKTGGDPVLDDSVLAFTGASQTLYAHWKVKG